MIRCWPLPRFAALPALPWRPMLGAGASVGPIRAVVVCVALCAAPASTGAPEITELLPRASVTAAPAYEASTPVGLLLPGPPAAGGRPALASPAPIPVPAPPALAILAAGIAMLAGVRR